MTNSKVHLINLGLLLFYMVVLTLMFKDMVLIVSVVPITFHILINLGLFVINVRKNKSLSLTYLLSAFLILLIGFPSCWGLASLSGDMRI